MGSKNKVKKVEKKASIEKEMEGKTGEKTQEKSWGNAREHKEQLQRLQEKDPEFYEYLKVHDKEVLEFDDDGSDEDTENDMDDEDIQEDEEDTDVHHVASNAEKEDESSKKVITGAMVDSWCSAIQENARVGAVRSIMKAFRTACHYGDDSEADPSMKLSIMSSSVFNKIMLFVLSEMDGILRTLLKLPSSGGKKETILDLVHTRAWKNYNHLVKSYLGNALHVLTQMTDTEMISFTLRRLKYSSLFLAAFPSLLRKYIKVHVFIPLHLCGHPLECSTWSSLLSKYILCKSLDSNPGCSSFLGYWGRCPTSCLLISERFIHTSWFRLCR